MKINYAFLVCLTLFCQTNIFTQIKSDPDSILVGNKKQPCVLLVGTFHFSYPNLDAHVTKENERVNVLSPQRQKEMMVLLDYIAKFRPTKIAVERGRNTGYLMKYFREYQSGKRKLEPDETEQIGFRLMERFSLDTIYGVDDKPLVFDLYNTRDSLVMRPVLDSIYEGWDFRNDDEISLRYNRFYEWEDGQELKNTLLDIFKFMNSDKVLNRGFGAYLNGDFTLGNTRGADALAMHWYSRNLRIYRHIQQITTSPDDRILVLFGAGHMGILKHLFECSPQYKLVKFVDL